MFTAALAVAAIAMPMSADVTTVKELFNNAEGQEVTWANTLKIEADQFAEGVNVGDYIYVTFNSTTDVIEAKSNGTWLPGSIKTVLGDNAADYKCYLTADGVAALKEYGLELCGAKFSVTSVSICNDGFQMPEGAIWGGYFWVDSWSTMELFKSALNNYANQKYMVINFADDKADNTNYFMKVLTQWDPEVDVATNDEITHEAKRAVVNLEGTDLVAKLAPENVNALMIQGNKEGGDPFNITSVVLTNSLDNISSVVNSIDHVENATVNVYNMQGVMVRNNVPAADALQGLPAGIYVAGNKKVMVK